LSFAFCRAPALRGERLQQLPCRGNLSFAPRATLIPLMTLRWLHYQSWSIAPGRARTNEINACFGSSASMSSRRVIGAVSRRQRFAFAVSFSRKHRTDCRSAMGNSPATAALCTITRVSSAKGKPPRPRFTLEGELINYD
jgi:hypothetical protein